MVRSKYNRGTEFAKPDLRFKALYLYAKGDNFMRIAADLGIQWGTVHKYITTWNKNRWGLTKEEIETALRNYDRWVD